MVVLDGEYRNLRFPIGGDEAYLRCVLHDTAGAVCQPVQYGRVRSHELDFDRIFFEHQVVALHLDVGIGIMMRQVTLYLVHVVYQLFGRSEIYNQFAVCQRRVGDAPYQIVASRCTAYGSGDVRHFLACFQVCFYLPEVLNHLCGVIAFGQFIFHI